MPNLFFSYSHADEGLRDALEKQLTMLRRQNVIETWHDRRISAGEDFASQIDQHVETDDIILLLVSADFLASDYCFDKEMLRAVERHKAGEAIVIPVILRACDWHDAPFGHLNAVPVDGKPVTQYPDRDQALFEVAVAIRKAAERLAKPRAQTVSTPTANAVSSSMEVSTLRSSNLRLAKNFSARDKDLYLRQTFEFIAKYFENSLHELAKRNSSIEVDFRQINANRFTATIYNHGEVAACCKISLSSQFGNGISYSHDVNSGGESWNEALLVESDDQSLFLRRLGMSTHRVSDKSEKRSQEGAAELYWSMLIEPLQR